MEKSTSFLGVEVKIICNNKNDLASAFSLSAHVQLTIIRRKKYFAKNIRPPVEQQSECLSCVLVMPRSLFGVQPLVASNHYALRKVTNWQREVISLQRNFSLKVGHKATSLLKTFCIDTLLHQLRDTDEAL